MSRVVHFELPADDPARAVGFYEKVFGWTFTKWDGPMPYWLITTGTEGRGIDGGLGPRFFTTDRTINTIDVSSVDEYVKKIAAAGGRVEREKSAIPGVGWLAYCRDTEGTLFGIMQPDEEAK